MAVNAGEGEGLRAWRAFVDIYDPSLRSWSAGRLLELVNWSFAGDIQERLESKGRAVVATPSRTI